MCFLANRMYRDMENSRHAHTDLDGLVFLFNITKYLTMKSIKYDEKST